MKNKIWERRFHNERKIRADLMEQLRRERQTITELKEMITNLQRKVTSHRADLEKHGVVFTDAVSPTIKQQEVGKITTRFEAT